MKFPVLLSPTTIQFPPAKGTKSRSLTEAEIQSGVMKPAEIVSLAENLKIAEPPMSLDQVRKRRATIKQDRKDTINFIKERTAVRRASRAAAMGLAMDTKDEIVENRAFSSPATLSTAPESSKSSSALEEYAEIRASLAKLEEDHNKD